MMNKNKMMPHNNATLGIIAIVFFLVAPSANLQAAEVQEQLITPTSTMAIVSPLLFLGNQNIAPVVFTKDDTPTGVAVDIVRALTPYISRPIEIKVMDWTTAQALVAEGRADALIQINKTEEREKIYDFSSPLLESQFSIFSRTNRVDIVGPTSLYGLRVGVEKGGLPEQTLKTKSQIELITIPNFLEGFKQLTDGTLDAIVVDYRVGSYMLAKNGIQGIHATKEPIVRSYSAIAVQKGNKKLLDEINVALQTIKTNGMYQAIITKWEPTEVVLFTQEQVTRDLFITAIVVLSILILIVVAWSITVNKELYRRRKTEIVLKKTSESLSEAERMAHLGSWELDITSNKLSWSDEIFNIFEIDKSKFGTTTYDAFLDAIHPDDKTAVNNAYINSIKTKTPYAIDHRILMKDGRVKYVHEQCETFYDDKGEALRSVGTIQDITNEKKAELAVRTSEATLHQSIDTARDAIIVMGSDKKIVFWNKAAEEIFGYERQEVVGKDLHAIIAPPEDQAISTEKIKHFAETGTGPIIGKLRELIAVHKDGHRFPVELSVSSTKVEGNWIATGIVRDITARKKAEEDIKKKSRSLRMLSNTNSALIHSNNEIELLKKICEIMLRDGGYRLVWIGYPDTKKGTGVIHPVAHAGIDEGYIDIIRSLENESPSPEFKTLESNEVTTVNVIETTTLGSPTWETEALARGYKSMIAMPVTSNGSPLAIIGIYSAVPNSSTDAEFTILKEIIDDLAFGITSLRIRAEHEASEEKFSATFHASPDMIVITRISDSVTLDVNKSFSEILGYSREETIGKHADDLHIWGSLADRDTIIKSIRETGVLTGFETTLRRKDGTTISGLGSARTIELSGEPCILSIIHDITSRKAAENERLANIKFMESMDKINSAILKTSNLDEMMSNVLDVVIEVMDCDRAWLLTPADPWILSYRVPMERARPGYPGALALGIEVPIDPETKRVLEALNIADGPVTFDPESDPPLPPSLKEHFGIQSQIVIKIYPKDGTTWCFGLHQCSYQRIWTDEEKRLFNEIGRRITDALTSLLSYRDLKQSEEKYSRIITTTTEGILSLDKEHNLTYINPRMLDMLGYTQEEMLGHKFEEYLPPEEMADHEHQMEERRKGNTTIYERRFRRKDGGIIWCNVSGTPILDEKGEYNGSFGMVTDITERKHSKDELQEQIKFSESLLRFSRNLEQSQTYGEALAAAQREIGNTIGYKNVWAYTVSEDKKYAYSIIATGPTAPLVMSKEGVSVIPIEGDPMMEKIVSSKDIVVVEDAQVDPTVNKEIVKKIGNRTIVNVPIVLFDRNLGSVGMGTFGDEGVRVPTKSEQGYLVAMASHMAVAFDRVRLLEERKKSEQNLANANEELTREKTKDEALLESLGEGIIAINKDGIIVVVNNAAEKITGWKEKELIGKNFVDIIPAINESGAPILPEDRLVFKVLNASTGASTEVLNYVRKNGSAVPVAVVETPFVLNNEVIGAVSVFRDITNEKEIEKTRGDLLALASHQLRTPLSGTKWLIETLLSGLKGPLSAEQKEYLDEIYKVNERMTTLVVDMLGVLRMESGDFQIKRDKLSTNTLLEALSETFTPVAKGKQITLNIEKDGEHTTETDALLLRNVIESFVSNAINYSDKGDKVVVSLTATDSELIFSVKDSGIGIPKDEQARLFERFYRASNAKTFNTQGTGLGLYIAATLAKKIGAQLSFESEEGIGSTFYIRIPITKENELNR